MTTKTNKFIKTYPTLGVVLSLCLACPLLAPAQGPTISGVVVDPTSGPIEDIAINVCVINDNGKPGKAIGHGKTESGDKPFTVKCSQPADRIALTFYDTSTDRARGKSQYQLVTFSPLSGKQDIVLNPVIRSIDKFTPRELRALVSQAEESLAGLSMEERKLVVPLVHAAIENDFQDSDYGFGEELAAVVKLIRPDSPQIKSSGRNLFYQSLAKPSIEKWIIDAEGSKANKSADIKLPDTKLDGSSGVQIAVSNGSVMALQTEKQGGQFKALYTILDGTPNVHATTPISASLTSASGSEKKPILCTGTAQGTVIVRDDPLRIDKTYTLKVGRTPVAATTVSSDGNLMAAIAIDGTYKVWRRKEGDVFRDDGVIASGRAAPFPTDLAISSDGNTIAIASGLSDADAQLLVGDLRNPTKKPVEQKVPSYLTKIQFTGDLLLTQSAAGDAIAFDFNKLSEPQLQLQRKFSLRGIEAFDVLDATGQSALKLSEKQEMVLVSAGELSDAQNGGLPKVIKVDQ